MTRTKPRPPTNVSLNIVKGNQMAHDAQLTWTDSTSSNVSDYKIVWFYNGVITATGIVPNYYSNRAFSADNPTITLKANDVVGATIQSDDVPDNLLSTAVTPPAVTIPNSPPLPPTNVTLTAS